MDDLIFVCSSEYKYELDESPLFTQGVFKDIKVVDFEELEGKKLEISKNSSSFYFCKKVDFLEDTYFEYQNFMELYQEKKIEVLEIIFQMMGAIEIEKNIEHSLMVEKDLEDSFETSVNLSLATKQNKMQKCAGGDSVGIKKSKYKTKSNKSEKIKLEGKKESKEKLKNFIEEKGIKSSAFEEWIQKAINDYLEKEEIGIVRREFEIDVSVDFEEEICRKFSIDGRMDLYKISFGAELKKKYDRCIKKQTRQKLKCRVCFK